MTTRTSGASDKSAVNLAVIIGVGVLVLIILVAVIVHSRSSQPEGTSKTILSTDPNAALVKQKALECKGDFRTLSTDDQNKLIALYGIPGAPSMIANVYRDSQTK